MASLNEHIVSSYEDELTNLNKAISEMGGMVEQAITESAVALLKLDHKQAQDVRLFDKKIDEMQQRINDAAVSIIARRQPMAADLRMVVTSIQVANDLERTGDMAKQLAKRAMQIESLGLAPKFYNGVKHMKELVARQLKSAIDAYLNRDAAAAVEVCSRDDEVDAMYNSLFRELLTYMMEDPRNITPCTHLLFCAKNIERIGDHATNIAETIFYMATGSQPEGERPKDDHTTSVGAVEE
jgi:phosphate transport system protein